MRKSILISALFILIIGAIGGFYMYQVLTLETKVMDERTIEHIDDISINTVTIDVVIEASKDSAVHIELIGNKKQKHEPQLLTSTNQGQLNIEVQEAQNSKWLNISLSPRANKLKIYVPVQFIQTLESKSDSGNLMIDGIKAEQFLIQTDVGDIRFKHTIGAYTIKSTTGNIKMELDK